MQPPLNFNLYRNRQQSMRIKFSIDLKECIKAERCQCPDFGISGSGTIESTLGRRLKRNQSGSQPEFKFILKTFQTQSPPQSRPPSTHFAHPSKVASDLCTNKKHLLCVRHHFAPTYSV